MFVGKLLFFVLLGTFLKSAMKRMVIFFLILILIFWRFIYLFKREKKRAGWRGAEDKEEKLLSSLIAECRIQQGTQFHDPEIVIWAKVSLMMEPPRGCSLIFKLILNINKLFHI